MQDSCTKITIVDDTCEYGDKLKCNVFESNNSLNKINDSCELGDIVRFHRFKVINLNKFELLKFYWIKKLNNFRFNRIIMCSKAFARGKLALGLDLSSIRIAMTMLAIKTRVLTKMTK